MSTVTLPKASMPIAGNLPVSAEWYRWFYDITVRAGGVQGASVNDLTLSQFEDAGIEESKALIFAVHDEVATVPTAAAVVVPEPEDHTSALREEIAALRLRIEALEQGTTI